jgi:beta-lactamase regulating signal transducer with metallopeptidase domain
MESATEFMCVLASSSLWLAGSGLVLWLCLRSRLRLSPGTRAVASMLIVLQGWIWIGIPVQIDPAWIDPAWIDLQPIGIPVQKDAPIDAAGGATPLPLDSRLIFAAGSMSHVVPMAGSAAAAIWMAGIAVILWRSICAFVALSRMVHALPRAPAEWQNELSALCCKQTIGGKPSIGSELVLKTSNVATPMLIRTWGSACIVFPAWLWKSCTAEQRTSILLHEIEHYRRGDVWRQLALRLLVLPHWFNPVAWWAASQFEAANEAVCDDVACGGDPLQAISYCKALLVLNERLGIRYAHTLAISGGSLTERIRRVLHPEFRIESQVSRFLILSAMIVLASLATIRIQAAGEPPESAKESNKDKPDKDEATTATVASLIANGGFEEPQEESDDPQGWFGTRVPQTAGHVHLSASSSVAHSGQRSAVVEIGASHPLMLVDYNWTGKAMGWKAGETYKLSGWIKTENAKSPAFIMAQCVSGDGKRIVGYSQKPCHVKAQPIGLKLARC